MAANQFLVRNRHCNVWYGRIVIPLKLREHFNGKREIRKSLGTSDRNAAKRLALKFWLRCQEGFDLLKDNNALEASFRNTAQFLAWLPQELTEKETPLHMPILKTLRGHRARACVFIQAQARIKQSLLWCR